MGCGFEAAHSSSRTQRDGAGVDALRERILILPLRTVNGSNIVHAESRFYGDGCGEVLGSYRSGILRSHREAMDDSAWKTKRVPQNKLPCSRKNLPQLAAYWKAITN